MGIVIESGKPGGVYIAPGAQVNIDSGDIVGGDKIVGGVTLEDCPRGVAGLSFPGYDEETNRFKRTIVLLGGAEVTITPEASLHDLMGGFCGRLILGNNVRVGIGEDGGLYVCGVVIPGEVLAKLSEGNTTSVRQTEVNDEFVPGSDNARRMGELGKVEIGQKLASRDGENEKGSCKLVVSIYRLEDGEQPVATTWESKQPMGDETGRQILKLIVDMGGEKLQLKALATTSRR